MTLKLAWIRFWALKRQKRHPHLKMHNQNLVAKTFLPRNENKIPLPNRRRIEGEDK
jgi:hypothetical protein